MYLMGCLGGLGVDGADPVAADGDDRIQAVLEAAGEQALLEAAGEQAVVEAGRVAGLQAVIVAAEHLHRDHASC